MNDIEKMQIKCCDFYNTEFTPATMTQLVVISDGVYEGINPIEGVRYPSPEHMSGWWLTTDKYDGNSNSLKTVHFSHILEHRPNVAIYMALPFGYRFILGGDEEYVWFDSNVVDEKK